MKSVFAIISALAAAMPLLVSCMMMDHEMILDEDGLVGLSVRGYAYCAGTGEDDEGTAGQEPAYMQPLQVDVYDRSDIMFSDPVASAYGVTSYDGYYEIDIRFSTDDDVIIRVSALDDAGNVTSSYVSSFYSWSGSLYDDQSDRYVANMPPLYLM